MAQNAPLVPSAVADWERVDPPVGGRGGPLPPRLQRREERVELLGGEATLATRRAPAGQVAGVRPAADRRDRHAEVAGGLGDGQAERWRGLGGGTLHGEANGIGPPAGERDDGFAQVRPAERRAQARAPTSAQRWPAKRTPMVARRATIRTRSAAQTPGRLPATSTAERNTAAETTIAPAR